VKTFLTKIYAYTFFDQFILVYPVYAILFKDSGLTPLQVGSLFGMWAVITILFEVPTGVLADKYSRKYILMIAQFIKALGYACWLFWGTYAGFALGFALWGFAGTLVSGTYQSFVYDELKHFGKEDLYEKVNGRIVGFDFVGTMLATLLGGFAAEFGYDKALIPSIAVPFIAIAILATITSVRPQGSTGESRYWTLLCEALREARANPYFLKMVAFFAVVYGVSGASDEYWGLLFTDMGVTLGVIGVIFAIANALSSLGGFTAHLWKLEGRRLYVFVALGGMTVLTLAYINSAVAIPLSFIWCYIIQVSATKMEARLQHAISSDKRATLTSMNSFFLEIVALAFYLGVGWLAKDYGYVSFLWVAGGVVAGVGVLYGMFAKEKYEAMSS
jgi:MFS family permease